MTTGDLFGPLASYPHAPACRADDTSHEAAQKIAPRVRDLHRRILAKLEHGPATADHIAAVLGEDVLTIRPRFSELRRLGLIVKAEGRGKSSRGNASNLWRRAAA